MRAELKVLEKRAEIEKFYKFYEDQGYEVDENARLKNENFFKLINNKLVFKYENETIRLTYLKNKNEFLAYSSLKSKYTKEFVRDVLRIGEKPKTPQQVEAQAVVVDQALPQPGELENTPTQDLGGVGDRVRESAEDLETLLRDAVLDTDFNTDNLLLEQSIRDLKSARTVFDSINDQIKITANKISGIDERIEQLEAEREAIISDLEEGVEIDEERLSEIINKIKELRKQREIQDKRLKQDLLPKIKSEFARIRETVDAILYSNKT